MKTNESVAGILTEGEKRLFLLARPHIQARNNEAHSLEAVGFALRLLDCGQGDRAVVVPALILHDMGWSKVSKEVMEKAYRPDSDPVALKVHEDESVSLAAQILHEIRYDEGMIREILEIIGGHDTREDAFSRNDQIVKDADKLTRYGRGFLYLSEYFSIPHATLAARLEKKIDKWFFLAESKQMAQEELCLHAMLCSANA